MNNNQLNQFQIFDDLNDDQISQFHSALKEVTIDKGKKFITEGEQGDSIYLLLSGSVEINQALTLSMNKGESDNREKAILKLTSEMHPQFGEMSIFNEGDRRTANVRAETTCTLARLDKSDLYSICDANPEIGYKVMRNLGRIISGNLVKANQNVLKLTTAFSLILDR
ncbi:MAG: cyclic nucleotide-binding domain-containing protein [Candidatus Marinimicrobia bacterium]|jgi:CRP-like cAMP-binding protein|nr:cyclic nucleotide-binding domain-containing protein [Candidatus Neomarinimicrobiota bacterium]MBT4149485.1 cyclic nucleotide-binding domain-containing protein [Candidatus Neomarinimicrobiota bacterium]MBT5096743.1 cyclic nucleotide-binding domain-containing protein [Candidatus Neomarinimicrobiota bacterium]MBT7524567.1 cyclic nucleotide-binding domain-containing protein [Candidatus Neomarinimicrobiota bacterium]|tara:strand:+ start:1091 stop:1594 length:504 start_codon:yes stop_codon:yes gene_type:complete